MNSWPSFGSAWGWVKMRRFWQWVSQDVLHRGIFLWVSALVGITVGVGVSTAITRGTWHGFFFAPLTFIAFSLVCTIGIVAINWMLGWGRDDA